jgi:gliding motility-associated-like protein
LPAEGTWTVTRYPGGVTTTGSGISDTIPGLPSGTYNFTVTNQSGCVSNTSANAIIPVQPHTPSIPVVGTITQPTYSVPTGSVVISGLPSLGWILTRLPDEVTTASSGSSITVRGLAGGEYFFTVTNSVGCVSDSTDGVIISTLGPPDLIITDPPSACAPSKVDLTAPSVTEGSTTGLTYTYWTDEEATVEYPTPTAAEEGIYYIKGTTVSEFFTIKPVNATIVEMPVANGGPDQTLALQFSTTMAAELGENESGMWTVSSGTGTFADTTDPGSVVNNLSSGINIMSWIVKLGTCPADTDNVTLNVVDLVIPTLITPNGDPKNEYFVVLGLSNLGKSELIVFDRRGAEVFRNNNYDNKWNGVDKNENPLPNDTYFFVLNSEKGRVVKGYIVLRR